MRECLLLYPRVLAIGGVVLVLTAIARFDPSFHDQTESDGTAARSLTEELQANDLRQDELHAIEDALWKRMVIKEHLISALMNGESSLAEVASQFHDLQRGDAINAPHPDSAPMSDLERAARQVLNHALPHLDDDTPVHRAIRVRLTCEFDAFLAAK